MDVAYPRTIVAVDVGGTKIAGAVVSYGRSGVSPAILHERTIPTDASRGGNAVLDDIVRLALELIAACDEPPLGVGVGTAGCVDPLTGSIAFANDLMPGWTGQPVAARLREATALPVAVMGDVHAHALGEARWGAARGMQSCLCVAAGTGLGGAFVADGAVMRGFRGAAGHLGHVQSPLAAGIPCACGASGHLESIASGTGLGILFDRLFPARAGEVAGGADVSRLAAAGDADAIEVLQASGRALGEALGSWANTFDPEVIVLSGSVLAAGEPWRAGMCEGFASMVMPLMRDTPIVDAALGGHAPLVGAAENLLDTVTL